MESGTRSRTRSKNPGTYDFYKVDVTVGGSDSISGPYLISKDIETMSDVVTKNFKKVQKSGETIMSPCKYHRVSRESKGSGTTSYSNWNTSGVVTFAANGSGPLTLRDLSRFSPTPPTLTVDGATCRRSACLQAIANIDKPLLSMGEDVAELKKTAIFVKRNIDAIRSEVSRRSIKNFAEVSESSWLSFRFAVAPLFRSLHSLMKEVSAPTTVMPPDVRIAHGRATDEDHQTAVQSIGHPSDRSTFSMYRYRKVSYHAAIRYQVKSPKHDWRWRYGLRNKDVPLVAWQVCRLSFMVDRLWDVSSMISAMTNLADPRISISGACIVERIDDRTSYQVTSVSSNAVRTSYSGSGEEVIDYDFLYTRSPFTPNVTLAVPPVTMGGLTKTAEKVADLIALFSSGLRSGSRHARLPFTNMVQQERAKLPRRRRRR